MSEPFEELSSESFSNLSDTTRQKVEDILLASEDELHKAAEAEMNERLNALAKKTVGIANDIERCTKEYGTTASANVLLGDEEDSDMEESYVDASKPIAREDIIQARSVSGRLKRVLHFCQGDHLEMAEAKVKLRPVLEGDIDDYEQSYQDVTRDKTLTAVHGLAETASETISEIKRIGQEEEASVVLITEILNKVGKAFTTCCHTLQVDMQSKKEAEKALEQFRKDSMSRLEKLRHYDMPAAAQLLEEAFRHLSVSQTCAASELSDVDRQVMQVEESNRLTFFDSLKREVRETIRDELRELKVMRDRCVQDITLADQEQQELRVIHGKCTDAYRKTVATYENEIKENQRQQEKLLQELRKLEETANRLTEARDKEKQMHQMAMTATVSAAEEIEKEVEKVQSLEKRASSSIVIMKKTEELSDLIFDTVIQKEHNLQETLGERLSTARRIYRKALLESAVAHKIEIKDHNINITHIKDQVKQLSSERRQRAQTALSARVRQIQTQLEELEKEMKTERSERDRNLQELTVLEMQIKELDKQYTDEDQLESVETLYKKRVAEIQEFWEMHADSTTVDSIRLDDQ
ncbi:uncharacterized protein LOC134197505 [Corticium candelabrum]|uniref:uncharacterized protein LOC134197505 n=1 Tax=Corticium candelabrum TaxID=121492 RepID=UPI002E26EA61|nr:uncharacterized protein LOC134197505 [Corticium candelabrum]